MLFITINGINLHWHVGEKFPGKETDSYNSFVVDGDELLFFNDRSETFRNYKAETKVVECRYDCEKVIREVFFPTRTTNKVIISRHPAAIQFIRETAKLNYDVPVIMGNATYSDCMGKHVYGNIPFSLAAVAEKVTALEFWHSPPRGNEYSLEDMKSAGAYLTSYSVTQA